MKLVQKKVLITGGAEGLGFELAKKILRKKNKVVVCARTKESLIKAKRKVKGLEVYQCDVSDYSQVEKMMNDLGRIDVLINAAGVWYDGQLEEYSEKQINQQIDINLKGVIFTCRAIIPQMKKRKNGSIVNISSTSGIKEKSNHCVYVASKWGVTGLTKSLQIDLMGSGVKVLGFYPGGMKTNLFKNSVRGIDNSNWMNPKQVAEIIMFMIERDETMMMDHVVVNRC